MLIVPLVLTNFGRVYLFYFHFGLVIRNDHCGGGWREHACLRLPELDRTNLVLFEGIFLFFYFVYLSAYIAAYM